MSSVISADFAYLASWFQSRHAMQMEILALRHPLAVYQHSIKRPHMQPGEYETVRMSRKDVNEEDHRHCCDHRYYSCYCAPS